MQHITLLIDGNFFAQRLRNIHGQDVQKLTFLENPERDEKDLIKRCTESLVNELNNIGEVDHIIIARDFSSWRKGVQQVYPLTTNIDEFEQSYKKNRDGEKDYDEVRFYQAYDKWIDLIQQHFNIQVIKTYGAEADDICYVVSRILTKKDPNRVVLVWSSDGDYYQMVEKNIGLIKLPKKELFLIKPTTEELEKSNVNTIHSVFVKKDLSRFKQICENFEKTTSVQYINPIVSIFEKIVQGDKKDNTPPLWDWWVGERNYKPSNTHIKKSFESLNGALENIKLSDLYDTRFIQQFIFECFFHSKYHERMDGFDKKTFKKEGVFERVRNLYFNHSSELVDTLQPTEFENKILEFIRHTEKVFESNRMMKLLYHKEIPKDILKDIVDVFQSTISNTQVKHLKEVSTAFQKMGLSGFNSSNYFNQFKNI